MYYYSELIKNLKNVAIYLRKSREDVEYEKKSNDYDTLLRHRMRLLSYANELNLKIDSKNIYEEVVSGDSISERPIIQKLLLDIETKFDAVLVIDVQRLTRGGYSDQGKIIDTFKYTNTIIITPDKIFDLSNKADEEYFADKLNYSRKEYEGIKKRLLEGRKDSVKEGKFIGSSVAYGYERYKLPKEKGYSLKIVESEAKIVRLIFQKCIENMGTFATATYLNKLGIATKNGKKWTKNGIREILHNKTYIGYVKWQQRKKIIVVENGTKKTKSIRSKDEDYLLVKGRHEPIISEEIFEKVQSILKASSLKYLKPNIVLENPLAGILRCKNCGKVMARRIATPFYYCPRGDKNGEKHYTLPRETINCSTKDCPTVSNNLKDVESLLIEELKKWIQNNKKIVKDYDKNPTNITNSVVNQLELIDEEITKEKTKLNRIMDFLEDGTYDKETYNIRSSAILIKLENLENTKQQINENNEEIKMNKIKSLIPKIDKVVGIYDKLNIEQKNKLLKSILVKVDYTKTKAREENDLTLEIYPKI